MHESPPLGNGYENRILIGITAVIGLVFGMSQAPEPATSSYIVQGESVESIAAIVQSAGGDITHELGIIRSVGATLTATEAAALEDREGVHRIFANNAVEVAGKPINETGGNGVQETHYPTRVLADSLHGFGINGSGVGIAILDTGLWKHDGMKYDIGGNTRISAVYNAITNEVAQSPMSGDDPGGHGSHVASIAVSSLATASGQYNGIAPGAHLVSVQAFDEFGNGTYADVVRAIDWVVAHKAAHSIRVLNLSFSAAVRSHYWDDPINQAVMVAWQEDIVVVAAAGNNGPEPMTIGVPGNVPYVITVGAMTDNNTPDDPSDDKLASFSAAGPTYEGFVKPEVVAPGGHMLGLMKSTTQLATTYPEFYAGDKYFQMSGTSQATGVVSGIAALILQYEPYLSADDVKCRIMSTALAASTGKGNKKTLTYSVYQQGAGLVNAESAVTLPDMGCANQGLDIDADVAGTRHFGGPANQDPSNGQFYIMGAGQQGTSGGYAWDGSYSSTDGYLWTNGYLWTEGYLWTQGYLWTDGGVSTEGYLWTDGGGVSVEGYLWTDGGVSVEGYLWTNALTEMATMSHWVGQE